MPDVYRMVRVVAVRWLIDARIPSSTELAAAQLSSVIHATTTLPLVSSSLLFVRAILLQMALLAADMTSHICHIGLFTPDGGI